MLEQLVTFACVVAAAHLKLIQKAYGIRHAEPLYQHIPGTLFPRFLAASTNANVHRRNQVKTNT